MTGELRRYRPIWILRPVAGMLMRTTDLLSVFHVADARRLHDIRKNDDPRWCQHILGIGRQALKEFADKPDHQLDFSMSVAAARTVIQRLDSEIARGGVIDWTAFDNTRERLNDWQQRLTEEFDRLPTYTLENVRNYSPNALLYHAEGQFEDSIKNRLVPTAVADFQESAKCLLFEMYTASGFHALRVLEGYSRRYYEIVTGRTLDPDKHIAWQVLIDQFLTHLGNEKKHKKPHTESLEVIVAHLQPIKDIFRNPISHPETILTRDKAIEVFETTAHLVSRMIEDADRRAPGKI